MDYNEALNRMYEGGVNIAQYDRIWYWRYVYDGRISVTIEMSRESAVLELYTDAPSPIWHWKTPSRNGIKEQLLPRQVDVFA